MKTDEMAGGRWQKPAPEMKNGELASQARHQMGAPIEETVRGSW
jgi:hypothetical protein